MERHRSKRPTGLSVPLAVRLGLFAAAACAAAGLGACSRVPDATPDAAAAMAVPAGPEAGMYSLAADQRGRAYLSWLEPTPAGLALRFSPLEDGSWGPPTTIVEGRELFSNWADHPSMAAQADGTLIAQWPVVNDGPRPKGSYNNSVRIARSRDRGRTWTQAFADGLDNTQSYTGFVSLLPTPTGARAVYLSPPRPLSHDPLDHRMTLTEVALDATGTRVSGGVVDDDTCSCCPTAIGMTADGPIAAYRDHEPGEIRDIAVTRYVDGAWTAPRPVHRDGWVMNGCPTNGPAIGAEQARVALAWFTAAGGQPRVNVAFSADSGRSFGPPTQVDGASATGRPATVVLGDGSAVVAWLASEETSGSELRVRRIRSGGEAGPIVVAGPAAPGRGSGMPQIAKVGASLVLAWRGDGLRTLRMPVPD